MSPPTSVKAQGASYTCDGCGRRWVAKSGDAVHMVERQALCTKCLKKPRHEREHPDVEEKPQVTQVTSELRDGWHDVSRRTRLLTKRDEPLKVETTRYDLDAALDDAAEFYGEPLERISPWLTDDGRDPEKEDCGNNTKVTCKVDTSASVHDARE